LANQSQFTVTKDVKLLDSWHSGRVRTEVWMTRLYGSALALAVAFGLIALALLLRQFAEDRPRGDIALIEIAVRRAMSLHRGTGPYSRFGWDHPGPLYFYLQAIPYMLLRAPRSLAVGACVINLTAIGGLVALTWRRLTRNEGLSALIVAASLLLRLGDARLWAIWNPVVLVFPTLVFLVSAALSRRSAPAVVLCILSGSFIAQTHATTVPLVVIGFAAVLAMNWTEFARVKWLLWAACLLLVVWLPPIIEQLTHDPGNLSKILAFAREPHHEHPWRQVAGRLAQVLWLPSATPTPILEGGVKLASLLAFLALFGIAVTVGVKARSTPSVILGGLCLAGFCLVALEARRTEGELLPYIWYWACTLPFAAVLAIAFPFANRLRNLLPCVAMGVTAGAILGCLNLPDPALRGQDPELQSATEFVLRNSHGAREIALEFGNESWPLAAGVADDLDRRGIKVEVPFKYAAMFDLSPAIHTKGVPTFVLKQRIPL
jgi:hypothetical protein